MIYGGVGKNGKKWPSYTPDALKYLTEIHHSLAFETAVEWVSTQGLFPHLFWSFWSYHTVLISRWSLLNFQQILVILNNSTTFQCLPPSLLRQPGKEPSQAPAHSHPTVTLSKGHMYVHLVTVKAPLDSRSFQHNQGLTVSAHGWWFAVSKYAVRDSSSRIWGCTYSLNKYFTAGSMVFP